MTGHAKRIGLAAAVVGLVAAVAGRASADYTYDVSLSVPNNVGGGVGTVSAVGTITVDMLGTLTSASDITGYTLAFSSANNPTTTVMSSGGTGNGRASLSGVTLTATSTELTGTFSPVDAFSGFTISDNQVSSTGIIALNFVNITQSGQLNITNQSGDTNPVDAGQIAISQTFTVGTAVVVPEPSSLALMGLGIAGLASARRRRRAKLTA